MSETVYISCPIVPFNVYYVRMNWRRRVVQDFSDDSKHKGKNAKLTGGGLSRMTGFYHFGMQI